MVIKRMWFWQRCESRPYCRPCWFQIWVSRRTFLPRCPAKHYYWRVLSWAGFRCRRPAFQSRFHHLLARDFTGRVTSLYNSMMVPDLLILTSVKWNDPNVGLVGRKPSNHGEFPELRYILLLQLPRKWRSKGTNETLNYKEFQRLIISLLTMRAHSSQTLSQGNKVSQWLAVRRGKAGVGWYRQGWVYWVDAQCSSAAAATAKSLQLCPTLLDPMDCNLPGSSVHGIF